MPLVLTFYNNPRTLEDQIHHIIGKILLQFGISYEHFVPWTERPKNKGPLLDKPGYLSVIISWDKIPLSRQYEQMYIRRISDSYGMQRKRV